MRGALVLVLIASASAAAAPDPATPPGPDDARARAILERVVAGPDTAARKAAIDELTAIAPRAVDAIGTWLRREHKSDVAERRAVLTEIKASVPDKTGKFSQPARQTGKEQKADDDLDWQAELLALDPQTAGAGEAIADDAAIRALAASRDVHAAQLIFDAAFSPETMIYRDECGRYLRKMEPASIPALTSESMGKDADRKRYATWQLERLDRQEPSNALDAALGDEALTVAILEVFRRTHHREAVHAVWRRVDADSPRVRAAARAAWMEYITGPPPPPAPVAKLNLPGGKKTKKAKPLWLTYRELADNELRKAANELLHEDYPLEDPTLDDADDDHHRSRTVKVDLEDLTRRLFEYHDAARARRDADEWAAAKAKSTAGDLAAATALVDRMLAANPERGSRAERAEMARLYLAWGVRQRRARRAPLHARQGARRRGQGRRPRLPARGRAQARLRPGAHRRPRGRHRRPTGVDAVRRGRRRGRRDDAVRARDDPPPRLSRSLSDGVGRTVATRPRPQRVWHRARRSAISNE
ncbi:MAG: hypothetical protein E6J91_02000 [Deltaproteobacteria bacterium]|nr:MAG: hypothetical protein E6J91_02000 [Deltaproteobacteria bacterium]